MNYLKQLKNDTVVRKSNNPFLFNYLKALLENWGQIIQAIILLKKAKKTAKPMVTCAPILFAELVGFIGIHLSPVQ